MLRRRGFKLIGRNWKTKVCEIDVIAQKGQTVYFVEVKYRARQSQGGGLEYITGKKLKRMYFAAEVWKQTYGWYGDCRLMAAAVSGEDCKDIEIVELD